MFFIIASSVLQCASEGFKVQSVEIGVFGTLAAVALIPRDDWITTEEVALAAGVDRTTISRWRQRELLPEPVLISGGRRGRSMRWPPDTAARALFLKQGLGFGYSFDDLRAALTDGTWRNGFRGVADQGT
ncbi:MerR family transcriptional regulator [Nannocystis sp.]|uniref:MerR family transcriptional regulator n=1 Tax=Nannocystis sp. TaxID=1962667 RepID=UPI0025EF862C|nr:MerR family transcriptional regulator [Nannocystis sp.]MBK7827218.1 hypothetical protein [Nannocystis sp.]